MSNYSEHKLENFVDISKSEYDKIAKYIYDNIGINLGDSKVNLVRGRLQKLLRKYNLKDFNSYFEILKSEKSGEMLSELADLISTNHTYFYREHIHFEYFLANALPDIIRRKDAEGNKDLRIWCAGCSSGEEPYMILMLMREYLGRRYSDFKAGILATDISTKALATAINGVYSKDRMNRIPPSYLKKYFKKIDNDNFAVVDDIKTEATFRRFNLMNESFPFKKPFDIIFCRNVMIYFDAITRQTLIQKFYDSTIDGGFLFIGHAETIAKGTSKYQYLIPAAYKK